MQAAVERAGYGVRGCHQHRARSPRPGHQRPATGDVTLPIEGMTCASCVRRIEKALDRVEGVREANVNLATEKAHVVSTRSRVLDELRARSSKAGYARRRHCRRRSRRRLPDAGRRSR